MSHIGYKYRMRRRPEASKDCDIENYAPPDNIEGAVVEKNVSDSIADKIKEISPLRKCAGVEDEV